MPVTDSQLFGEMHLTAMSLATLLFIVSFCCCYFKHAYSSYLCESAPVFMGSLRVC